MYIQHIIYSHSLCLVLLSLSFYNIERHFKKWTFVTYDQILDRGIINKNTHVRYYIYNRLYTHTYNSRLSYYLKNKKININK